jgi:hypothetical protein
MRAIGPKGTRWERVIEGTIVFQEGTLVVLETPAGHRALWLSAADGSTLCSLDFVEQSGAPPPALRPCGDRLLKWFRADGAATAAICLVLD